MMDTPDGVYNKSAQAVIAPILSFLSLILCIPAMIWHMSNRNWGASFLVAFVMYGDSINILNALIWPTDDVNSWWDGAVLCDIQVKFSIATQVGMPGALLCIFRNLAIVMDVDNAALVPTRAQRLHNKVIDVFFCIALPVLAMITHFVVQGDRYIIFAIAGCNASFDESWPSITLSYMWPLIVCIAAACYCVLIILRLKRYRSEISTILGASSSNLTTQRFMRLFGLSSLMILIILPLQTYVFYTNIRNLLPLHPYSWKALHGPNFSSILKIQTDGNLKFDRWIPVALGFLIFGFFGLGQDAANMYHSFFNAVGLKSLSTSFSSQGATSPHGGKSGSWYGTLRSRNNSWLGMKRASTKSDKDMSVSSSHTDTIMLGDLDRDAFLQAAGPYESTSVALDPNFQSCVAACHIRHKNDCNV